MILVTGATGALGKVTIEALLKFLPPQQIAVLVRDPEKAAAYSKSGITVKKGDYSDFDSLAAAFTGIEKLLMISAPAFSDQHFEANTIRAAIEAGIKYIVYTGIQGKKGSGWVIPGVTERDIQMEKLLNDSGIAFTIVRNALYADVLLFLLGDTIPEDGIRFPSGEGRVAVATREDLGEALARIIGGDKQYPGDITLSNTKNWSFKDIEGILSEVLGRKVPIVATSRAGYVKFLEEAGFPAFRANFSADWADAIKAGEFEETDPLLGKILGREPTDLKTYFLRTGIPG